MSDETPRLRLRPKLAADAAPPVTPAAAPVATATASAGETDRIAAAAPLPVVKFRPRVPDAPSAVDPNLAGAPNPVIAVVVPDPPAPPVPPPAVAAPQPPPLPPSTSGRPAAMMHSPVRAASPAARPRSAKKVQFTALAIGLGGVLVFAAVGLMAYRKMSAMLTVAEAKDAAEQPVARPKQRTAAVKNSPPPPAPVASTAAKTPPPGPATAKPAVPAAKTTPAPAASATSLPAIATAPAAPAPAPTPVAATTTSAAAAAADAPNAAAQAWLNKLKISGARGGSSPRVLIGGKTYLVGDTVSPEFGLVFAAYDSTREILQFKDAGGIKYERRVR